MSGMAEWACEVAQSSGMESLASRGNWMTSRILVLLAAILFSTGGAGIKAVSLSSWQIASFRSGISALAIALLLPSARKAWSRRTFLIGSAFAAAMILYVLANRLTTAANTIFLIAATPLYVLLLGPWLLKEPIRRRDILLVLIFLGGLTLFFVDVDPPVKTAPMPMLGNLFATVAGFCFALGIIGLRWSSRSGLPVGNPAMAAVLVGNLIAFLVCLPMATPIYSGQAADWFLLTYLGVVQVGLSYFVLTIALRRVPAMEASLLLLLEPVLNPVWAWLIHGEQPGAWSLAGGAVILLATLVLAVSPASKDPTPASD